MSAMADFLLGGQIDPARHERTATPTTVASGDFTTHGVIVGMTGSGKTGLGIVLVEEALRAGVPALLIDPKGDLTNLCLTFPDLAPADFEPWVNEGDATEGRAVGRRLRRRAGEGVDGRPGRLGHRHRADRARCATSVDVHDLHAGLQRRRRAEHRRLAAGAGRRRRRRGRRRRDRGLRQRAARPRRHRRRPAVEPRAHPAVEPHPSTNGPRAAASTCRRSSARCSTRRSASSACSTSTVLPAEGSHGVRRCGSTVCWRRRRSARGRTARRSTSRSMLQHTRRQAAVRDRHDRAPQRRRAPVRDDDRAWRSS